MSKRVIICLFVLCLTMVSCAAFGANLQVAINPGFENGTDPAPWGNQPAWGTCTGSVVSTEAHTGTYSWQTSGAAANTIDCVEQAVPIIPGGLNWALSYWVKIPTASPTNPVKVDIRAWFGTPANFYISGFWSAGGASGISITSPDWTLVTDGLGGCTPAAECTQLIMRCRVTSTDPSMVAYIDDVSVSGAAHSVNGKVIDTLGNPISGAKIFIGSTNPPATTSANATTIADGTFTAAVADGIELFAMAKDALGFFADSSVATLPASTSNATIPDFVLTRLGTVKISGKVVDFVTKLPMEGVTVGANVASGLGITPSSITTTTAADGTYALDVLDPSVNPVGTYEYYVVAKKLGFAAVEVFADVSVGIVGGVKTLPDIELSVDPDYDTDMLFSVKSSALSAASPWPTVNPGDVSLTVIGSPGVVTIGSQQWEQNVYTSGDGFVFPGPAAGGTFTDPIPVNGASIVAVVKPQYRVDGGWGCVFNAFYNDLSLNVNQVNGEIGVFRNGYGYAGPKLLDGQKAVLSLVVQPDGQLKLFVNGAQAMATTDLSPYTQMFPGGWNWNSGVTATMGFAHNINIGRNAPDGWSTFNGNIGDVSVYKVALDDTKRAALENALMTKFGIDNTIYTISSSSGTGGSISPIGAVLVPAGTDKTFTITPDTGYKILDVLVDGLSVGTPATYTFVSVAGNHSIAASFEILPTAVVTGTVTDGAVGIEGAKVYFKPTASAASGAFVFATTGPGGTYSQTLPIGHWFVAAGAAGYDTSADTEIDLTTAGLAGVDFVLTVNPNWDVFFSATVDQFGGKATGDATGNWTTDYPVGGVLNAMATPTIATVDAINMIAIDRDDTIGNDGFNLTGTSLLNGVDANGVSVVAVVQPKYTPIGGEARGEFVNLYYNGLSFAINHNTGEVIVCRKGNWVFSTGVIIPDGQKSILSLVCQLDGSAKLYVNGIESWTGDALGANYFARLEGTDMNWMTNVGVGRNPWDGWSSFNGNMGDVYVYRDAISDQKREALQSALATKFDIHVPVFTTVSGLVTLSDGETPVEGAKITCIGNVMTSTTSAADGTYSVNVEADTYVSITATKENHVMVYPVDGQYDMTVGTQPIENLNFKFTPVNTINGTVIDVNGKPINNAVVQVGGVGGPGALTGPDGKYMIAGITIGSVELYADALGFADNTQTIDTTPAASGLMTVDITLNAKEETYVIKNGGFEEVTAGVPNEWTVLWINTTVPEWPIVYTNPVPGNTDIFSATTDCVTGTYAAKYSTTSEWTFFTQEIPVIPGNAYNFYMKLKGDTGVPNIFPMFAFRNDAGDELGGYVSAEAAPYNGWAFAPPTTWKSFLHWNTYGNGLAQVPSLRLTPPAGTTKITVWIGFTDAPAGKAVYADDVVVDRVGPDTLPAIEVASIKALKAQPVGTLVKLLGSKTVTLVPTADGVFYVGEESRISGLRVVKSGAVLNAGDSVTDLVGTVKKTAGGEIYLELDAIPAGTAGAKLAPLAMNNKVASEDAKALSNLVKVWGKVTVSGSNFTITDGYSTPITVLTDGATLPAGFDGSTAAISGVVSRDDAGKAVILLGGF